MAVKVLIILGCVLYVVIRCNGASEVSSSVSTSSDCPTGTISDSFGYELLLTKLEDLESKFWNMWIEMKEHNEQIMRNHSRLENTHQGMLWMLTAVGHNLTSLMDRSWEILQQQVSCANHDSWKQSVLAMVKKPSECSKQPNDQLVAVPKSCSEAPANVSGKYMLQPLGFDQPFEAYCEQEAFGGGWLVVQYRFNGSVDFYRNWTEYRNGFGSLDGEFWLGLETQHRVTASEGNYVLMVEIKDYYGNYKYARYDEFEIGSEDEMYSLKKLGTYSGTAGDSLVYQKTMKFSTMERDNDASSTNCAQNYHGAWWYKDCHYSNLNGLYQQGNDGKFNSWYHAKAGHDGLKYSRMMIRKV